MAQKRRKTRAEKIRSQQRRPHGRTVHVYDITPMGWNLLRTLKDLPETGEPLTLEDMLALYAEYEPLAMTPELETTLALAAQSYFAGMLPVKPGGVVLEPHSESLMVRLGKAQPQEGGA